MVANDDRILRLSMNNSPRFKERIIKDYKATLIAKRKNEVGLLRAASKLAEANVSTKALRAIRSILNDMGFRYVLPTEEDLKDAANRIDKCVADDLVVTPTEDGWFASPTATLESELLRRLQMAAAANTKDLSGGRVIGTSGPGCMGWQAEATCKITMDARTVTQKQSQTETTMQIFKPGAEGSAESHKALSLRTLGIWMGKDSREKVQANTKPFFEEIQQLMEHGVVFNREAGSLQSGGTDVPGPGC